MAKTAEEKAEAKKLAAQKKAAADAAKAPKMIEVEVTQEMLDANPEWATNGVVVGDTIEIPNEDVKEEPPVKPVKKGKSGLFAIVTNNGEYIRTYEDEDLAEEFVGKDGNRKIVDPSEISILKVTYDVKDAKTGVISQKTQNFSFEDRDAAIDLKHEKKGVCLYQ